jgi:NitT/TauT family transport system substrate-binding protein
MTTEMLARWNRRRFLRGVSSTGVATLLGMASKFASAESPPETTRLRLVQIPTICQAPQYVAEEFLRAEGFTDLEYVRKEGTRGIEEGLASGEVDINMHFAAPTVVRLDAGDPIVVLAGGHVGCFELFASPEIHRIGDLRGKTVAIPALGSSEHTFLASMLAYVGVDPNKQVTWANQPFPEAARLLEEGKIAALLALPPRAQELRAKRVGHVVVDSAVDRPWSQYFCCMVVGNREFVRKHPIATKRALRAIVKGADLCALEPEWAARFMVAKGFTSRYDYALESVRALPYRKWREYDPEDTLRFYALRLREAGMVKAAPQKLLANGTDWQFMNALRKELKG